MVGHAAKLDEGTDEEHTHTRKFLAGCKAGHPAPPAEYYVKQGAAESMEALLPSEGYAVWQRLCAMDGRGGAAGEGGPTVAGATACNPVTAELEASGAVMAALTEDSHALDNVFEFNGHAFSVSWSSDGRLKGSDKLITKSAEATVLIERVRQPASLSFQVVNNLKEFRKKTCIKRTALLALSFTASSKDLEDLAAQFKEFDVDCTGAISLADFTNQMRAHPAAADTSDDDLRAQFAAIDQDNSGEIQYTEFLAAAMTQRIYTDAHMAIWLSVSHDNLPDSTYDEVAMRATREPPRTHRW